MKSLKEHTSFWFAAVLLIAALFIVYPWYQFYIDPDATSYLTIAKRYAAGDFQRAINGYWSPWSIWLTALLIKVGFASFQSAIIVNAAGALGLLFISYSLFVRFGLENQLIRLFTATLALFLVYAIFKQSFDDLWECFFLLVVLRLTVNEQFIQRPALWIAAGIFGAFAYYAKAYAFPFFIINIICCTYFITRENPGRWLKISLTSIATMIICCVPWIYLLHEKYGIWTTGSAGSLNLSWYLVGHPFWKEGIMHLLPPIYSGSPSYWEDPWYVIGDTPHFWNSPKLFVLQLVRMGYNLLKMVQSMNELSAFFLFSFCVMLIIFVVKNTRRYFAGRVIIPVVSCLLFPLGYLFINFEARYLWYMLPLSMIIMGLILPGLQLLMHDRHRNIFNLVFAVSFLVYPILDMKAMYRVGEREYNMAQVMKQENIRGSFTTNIPYGKETQHIMRLAYFSANPYYQLPLAVSYGELLKEIRRYRVNYYLHFYNGDGANYQLKDENGNDFPEVAPGKVNGLKIFRIH